MSELLDCCEHVWKLKNYLRRNRLAIEDSSYPELSVYCGICEDYYDVKLDVSTWVDEEEEE